MSEENDKLIIQGFKSKKQPKPRYPVNQAEGVHTSEFPRQGGDPFTDSPGAVSLSKIQVLDLISEGEIEGLVTGEYKYVGTLGNIGYDSVTETLYSSAPNTSIKWLRSIYWNDVPVVNSNNEYNFQAVDVAFTPGLSNGSTSLLSNELTVSRNLGERLRYGIDFAKVYRLINKDIKAFEVNVRFNNLSKTNTTPAEYGDTEETTVVYVISWRPLYSTIDKTPLNYPTWQQEVVRGLVSQGYIRTTRVNLFSAGVTEPTYEPDFLGWEVRIHRGTPDSINNQTRNQTYIDSITEVFGDVFTYPNSAIVSSKFSAEFFSQIPNRSYDTKLLKIKLPSNYNPITKTYAGDWDGTFTDSKHWSDNPAWCFYDIITNKRYGLGKYITEDQVDKWTLYQIGRYCDQMVPDGEGDVEPRFTCNLILNTREEAYKVINDMASIFRAMTYYFAGSIYAVQDSFKSPIYQFTNANVEDGNFQYASSSRRVRHTVAIVRYNDKNNFYKPAVEQVEDFDGIRKYGFRELEITAFGCTSRGQALRLGRWALLSETLETESVSFVAGIEGAYLKPGDIIQTQDNNRTQQRFGGRVYRIYDSGHFVLDSHVTGLDSSNLYYLSVLTPSYNYDPSQVTIANSADYDNIRRSHVQKRTLTVSEISGLTGTDGYVRSDIQLPLSHRLNVSDYTFTGNPVWIIEGSGIGNKYYEQWDYYRVLRIEEQDDNKFAVAGIQYVSGKFNLIESGIDFQEAGYSSAAPAGPINLDLLLADLSPNTKKIIYTYTVPNPEGIVAYRVYVKKDADFSGTDTDTSTYLIASLQAHERGGTYIPDSNGIYYFRVYSVNRLGTKSTSYANDSIEVTNAIGGLKDLIIGNLILDDENFETSIVGGSRHASEAEDANPLFKWQLGLASNGIIPSGLYYRLTIREPSNNATPKSNIYFEETGLLKNEIDNLFYEFSFEDNRNSTSKLGANGPFRNYDVVVEAMTYHSVGTALSSAGGNFVGKGLGDSSYTNPNGYDILAVTNPPVEKIWLTDGTTDTTRWQTEQWISPEGEIKIRFIKSSFPPDVAGAYVYFSGGAFTKTEAIAFPSANKVTILESGNPLVVHANLTGVSNEYISISLFDEFDVSGLFIGRNIDSQLNMSNVVRISKRSDIDNHKKEMFRAWAEVQLENSSSLNVDTSWPLKSMGFSNIEQKIENGVRKYRFTFDTPFVTTNYVVFHSFNNSVSIDSISFTKSTTHFDMLGYPPNIIVITDPFFIGVVYNNASNEG